MSDSKSAFLYSYIEILLKSIQSVGNAEPKIVLHKLPDNMLKARYLMQNAKFLMQDADCQMLDVRCLMPDCQMMNAYFVTCDIGPIP